MRKKNKGVLRETEVVSDQAPIQSPGCLLVDELKCQGVDAEPTSQRWCWIPGEATWTMRKKMKNSRTTTKKRTVQQHRYMLQRRLVQYSTHCLVCHSAQ